MMRVKVVSALVLSAMFASSAWSAPVDRPAKALPEIKVTRTVLPQEETKRKMPLLLLAIIAAAADSREAFRAKIRSNSELD